jgi:hypothetical protein
VLFVLNVSHFLVLVVNLLLLLGDAAAALSPLLREHSIVFYLEIQFLKRVMEAKTLPHFSHLGSANLFFRQHCLTYLRCVWRL